MSNKGNLKRLIDVLSEDECRHLLSAIQEVAAGERFWEGDVGIFYNEYVKARYFNLARNLTNVIPAGPIADEGIFVPITLTKYYHGVPRFELPPPEPIHADFLQVVMKRRSRRDYSASTLSLKQLSSLLRYACGTTGFVQGYDYDRLPLRSFPSSGGLQVPEIYLSVQGVDALAPGIYHYHPVDHALELLKAGDYGAILRDVSLKQPHVATAALVVIITGYYERLRWKYGERSYRYMCMDIGFLGENIHLTAEALGLGACAIAGFVDDAVEELLGIDGKNEIALLLMTVGARRDRHEARPQS